MNKYKKNMEDFIILVCLYAVWYIKISITYIRMKLNEKEEL
jgi:hypothetical protein